mmetsp:Transcript_45868/g.139049  ORF Transcript_45868/g.139049 Transcript_45868/m.139049 type:complete len:218 (+) Transcript_45868:313-966(+)
MATANTHGLEADHAAADTAHVERCFDGGKNVMNARCCSTSKIFTEPSMEAVSSIFLWKGEKAATVTAPAWASKSVRLGSGNSTAGSGLDWKTTSAVTSFAPVVRQCASTWCCNWSLAELAAIWSSSAMAEGFQLYGPSGLPMEAAGGGRNARMRVPVSQPTTKSQGSSGEKLRHRPPRTRFFSRELRRLKPLAGKDRSFSRASQMRTLPSPLTVASR